VAGRIDIRDICLGQDDAGLDCQVQRTEDRQQAPLIRAQGADRHVGLDDLFERGTTPSNEPGDQLGGIG